MGFRDKMLNPDQECLVHVADNLAQFTKPAGDIFSKSDRALACATPNDIVVLDHPVDRAYQSWLRALGLGTDHVVTYDKTEPGLKMEKPTLSQRILKNPEPVMAMIKKTGKNPVYLPWYSGPRENEAARVIHAPIFGASADLTLKYNDKSLFKQLCRDLDIRVVEETCFDLAPGSPGNFKRLEAIVQGILSDHGRALARAVMDNTGLSMAYVTDGTTLDALYRQWQKLGIEKLIIEPFLAARHSPCGQWMVTRKKEIVDTGMVNQMLSALWHRGSIKTHTPPEFDWEPVQQITRKIAAQMAASGYVGVVGIDFIQTDAGVFPVENNARLNGSSYVKLIVEQIEAFTGPVPCWKSLKAKTAPCTFEELAAKTAPLLYGGKHCRGYFPYNCEKLCRTGEFAAIMMARDLDGIAQIERELNRLGIF